MTDLRIACTLTSDAMTDRLAFIEKLAHDGLIARESVPRGVRVRLRDTADVERRTRELIAAESSCCSFLTFSIDRADATHPEDVWVGSRRRLRAGTARDASLVRHHWRQIDEASRVRVDDGR